MIMVSFTNVPHYLCFVYKAAEQILGTDLG